MSDINSLIEIINKKYKIKLSGIACDFKSLDIKRIPFDNFILDYMTYGGIPVGRITEIWGYKSSGKTTTALRIIKNAQNMCANCYLNLGECKCKKTAEIYSCFIDAEGVYSTEWARTIGIDEKKLILVKPEYSEQAFEIMNDMIKTKEIGLIVLDSIAGLAPYVEVEKDMTDWQQGMAARLLNKALRKWVSSLNKRFTEFGSAPTIILINQMRQKIGVFFGDPSVKPGGIGQDFSASLIIKTNPSKVEVDDETNKPIYVEISNKIEKSKVSATTGMEGTYKMALVNMKSKKKGDILDEEKYVINYAIQFGIIEKRGNKYICGKNELDVSNKEELEELLINDRKFFYLLKNKIIEINKSM